jgi:2-polyprenyl-6-methoxyphenol hydroxylase-like FAD-dependent oxidoreductase
MPDEGLAVTADGTEYRGDVVIAADGIRSNVRPFIVDEDVWPQPSGESGYRMMLRLEDLQAINSELLENGAIVPTVHMVKGPERKIIAYPSRGGQLFNCVAYVRKCSSPQLL